MSAKYTPGPWKLYKTASGRNGIEGADGSEICKTDDDAEGLATARLIAAAPDMLDALKYALAMMEEYPDEAKQPIRAAIAKVNQPEEI